MNARAMIKVTLDKIADARGTNVRNAGICHLGSRGTGSPAACGNERAHQTFGSEQFGAKPAEERCKRCEGKYNKWQEMKAKRGGAQDLPLGQREKEDEFLAKYPKPKDAKQRAASAVRGPGGWAWMDASGRIHGPYPSKEDCIADIKANGYVTLDVSYHHTQGAQAKSAGQPESINPYPAGSDARRLWQEGYNGLVRKDIRSKDAQFTVVLADAKGSRTYVTVEAAGTVEAVYKAKQEWLKDHYANPTVVGIRKPAGGDRARDAQRWGVWARTQFGSGGWTKSSGGKPETFATEGEARAKAERYNKMAPSNYYGAKPYDDYDDPYGKGDRAARDTFSVKARLDDDPTFWWREFPARTEQEARALARAYYEGRGYEAEILETRPTGDGVVEASDYRTERGFVARASYPGGAASTSPMFITPARAHQWLKDEIAAANRRGVSVIGTVRPETADPAYMHDAAEKKFKFTYAVNGDKKNTLVTYWSGKNEEEARRKARRVGSGNDPLVSVEEVRDAARDDDPWQRPWVRSALKQGRAVPNWVVMSSQTKEQFEKALGEPLRGVYGRQDAATGVLTPEYIRAELIKSGEDPAEIDRMMAAYRSRQRQQRQGMGDRRRAKDQEHDCDDGCDCADCTRDDSSWVTVRREQFDGMSVGKLYKFDGRTGRVMEKSESQGTNAAGWAHGVPMVRVQWKAGSDHRTVDPPKSESQRRAAWAAAGGKSTLGIPQSAGKILGLNERP